MHLSFAKFGPARCLHWNQHGFAALFYDVRLATKIQLAMLKFPEERRGTPEVVILSVVSDEDRMVVQHH